MEIKIVLQKGDKMTHSFKKEILTCGDAPKPIGPYSVGIKAGHFIFVSGQLGLSPQSGTLVEGGIKEQTRQAMTNIKNILESSNSSLNLIVKTTVFLKDIKDFTTFNEIYAGFFQQDPPARSAVQVAALPKEGLVEIEVVALSNEKCKCGEHER
jgi:2-iminobutanoate/2-iminopropanoate deaminase